MSTINNSYYINSIDTTNTKAAAAARFVERCFGRIMWCGNRRKPDKEAVPITTKWYDEIHAGTVPHDVYPNPQLERADWMNLNGLWNFAGNSEDFREPSQYETQILVPYAMESALSGVMQHYDWSWYNRTFTVPADWDKTDRVILHFEAVDWKTTVYVNGRQVATNASGYESFSADITDALLEGENQLSVKVYDNAADAGHTVGKQKVEAGGIYYTQCSGIWGTVWMEPVSAAAYIGDIKIDTDVDNRQLGLTVTKAGSAGATVDVTVKAEDQVVATVTGLSADSLNNIDIPEDRLYLWSPDSPFLYDLTLELKVDGKTVDTVKSYFGMRKIEVRDTGKSDTDTDGKACNIQGIYLNEEPIYQFGFLDQGYFPESNYTAPTDEALRQEIQNQKDMGYNMVRKHIKVEPKRWYYYCDKLGLLVWQDFVNGNDMDFESFAAEGEETIRRHWNHPSIVMWILYNESWGQHDKDCCQKLVDRVRALDSSRLVSIASGWNDHEMGDIIDNHTYPGPWYSASSTRARVNGEFGGLQYVVQNHLWSDSYWDGYTNDYGSPEALLAAYQEKIAATQQLKNEHGLQASVYTQYTDVEGELNGLMTYDRQVLKVDLNGLFITNQNLIHDSQVVKTGLHGAFTRVALKDSSLYTQDSWSKVLAACDEAHAIDQKADATQTEVYQTQQKLLKALDALVGVG